MIPAVDRMTALLGARRIGAILLAGVLLASQAVAADAGIARPADRRQTALNGPLLGYAAAADRSSVELFRGVPGAAFAGAPVLMPEPMRALAVSSERAFALAIRASSGHALVYRLNQTGNLPVGLRVSPAGFEADRVQLSPTGSSAILFDAETRTACILRGLPVAPEVLRFVALSGNEPIGTLAVRDDGEEWLAVLRSGPESAEVVSMTGASATRTVYTGGRDLQVRFEPRGGRILIADRDQGQVWMASGSVQARSLIQVPAAQSGAPLDAVFSRDIVAVLRSGGLISLHPNGREAEREVDCSCLPAGLAALSGVDLFQVSAGRGAVAVVRVDLENPLVFLVAREGSPESPPSHIPMRARQYR